MSKKEEKLKVELVDRNEMLPAVSRLYGGLDALVETTKSKKTFAAIVATESTRKALAQNVATFATVDAKFEGAMLKIGKLCEAILKLDEHAQTLAINEIAMQNGLNPTKDTGRKGLAYALFGSNPDFFKASGKDTIAGKRLSSYLSAAKGTGRGSTGKTKGRPKLPAGANKANSAHALFDALYERTETEKEADFLIELCQRAKIEYEDWLTEWTGDEESTDEEKK